MLQHIDKLVALAKEPSSDRRRELLREISTLFIANEQWITPKSQEEFAGLAGAILDQLDVEVRAEFAARFARTPGAPVELMARLAHDVIEVARPVLTSSPVLSDPHLVDVVEGQGQDHMRAISERASVSENVSDAIVSRGDDRTLTRLASNPGAQLSRHAFETLTEKSESVDSLRRPLVSRDDTPADLLHDMIIYVEDELRRQILERFESIDPAELERALVKAADRAKTVKPKDPGLAKARRAVREMKVHGKLTRGALVEFLRGGDHLKFVLGLADLLDLDYDTTETLWKGDSLDCLAIALRSADCDRAFFVTLAMEREGVAVRDPERAREFGDAYESIPHGAAQRAMRFWRIRNDVGSSAIDADAA